MDLRKGEGPKYAKLRVYESTGVIAKIEEEIKELEDELLRLQGKDSKKPKRASEEGDSNGDY